MVAVFDILVVIGILASAILLSISLVLLLRKVLTRVINRKVVRLDESAISLVRWVFAFFIFASGLIFALRYWDLRYPRTLPEWLIANFDGLNTAFAIIISTSLVILFINSLTGVGIQRITEGKPELEGTFRLLNRLVIVLVYVVGVIAALTALFPTLWGALTTILFGAGFLGIVVGLASQKIIGNILSGINLIITHPIRIGDAVLIRSDFGFVEDIRLRHTIIRTWDNRRLIIPNNMLDDEAIINYTLIDQKKLFPITVHVPYDTDIEMARRIMVEEAEKHPNVLPELKPIFQVLDFTEGAITLRLLFMAKDQPTAFNTAVELRYAIKKRFDQEGIRLSCPVRYIITQQGTQEIQASG